MNYLILNDTHNYLRPMVAREVRAVTGIQSRLYTSVMLIHAKMPVEPHVAAARDLDRPALVFFHSEAVDLLSLVRFKESPWRKLSALPDIDLVYCTSAWRRRGGGHPPPGVVASTLTQFWAHQLQAWRSDSRSDPADNVVNIGLCESHNERGWQEILELILAAAALDIPMRIGFKSSAWRSMKRFPTQIAAWRQLTDFDLATVTWPEGERDLPNSESNIESRIESKDTSMEMISTDYHREPAIPQAWSLLL